MKSSSGYEIYHSTLSSVLDEVERYVQSKGYEVGDYFPLINHVSYGTTEKADLELLKNGRLANNLKIQIYRMESGKYELNCYPVRNFQKGNIVDKFAGGGKVLWGVKKGDADWNEQIITENEQQIENAKKWAVDNGFDRFRIQMIDLSTPPDFKKTFKNGGGIESVKVGNKYHYKFDNKNYEVLAIENSKVVIAPIPLGSFWNNREISFSLMNKWIVEEKMVQIMATGGATKTYKDLSKETPLIVNDSASKMGKVPEIDIIKTGDTFDAPIISNSSGSVSVFKKFWNNNNIEILEQMNVMFLNKANKPIGIYQHSKGGIDGTILDIEIISAMAVKSLAKAVIIAHNHPSGNLRPSEPDKRVTKKLTEALNLFDISLLDSLIITKQDYFSFADEGLIN